MEILKGRTVPIHQALYDAALAQAGPIGFAAAAKLAYAINLAHNELGLLPPAR
jgi:hypothetical protein